MAEKEYVCAYKYCLHHGEKVKASESVVINKKHYHWDCAGMKQEIQDCVDSYMECIEDKTQYPIAIRTINTLVFKNLPNCITLINQYKFYMDSENYFGKKNLEHRW